MSVIERINSDAERSCRGCTTPLLRSLPGLLVIGSSNALGGRASVSSQLRWNSRIAASLDTRLWWLLSSPTSPLPALGLNASPAPLPEFGRPEALWPLKLRPLKLPPESPKRSRVPASIDPTFESERRCCCSERRISADAPAVVEPPPPSSIRSYTPSFDTPNE